MMFSLSFLISFAALTSAKGPAALPVSTLVSFGDSYTDQIEVSNHGGTSWPVYASGYGNFSIIDVAVSGSVCNQSQVNRTSPVLQYQIPQYLNRSLNGSTVNASSTVYSIWIGTNDVGIDGLFGGNQTAGVSIVDTTRCSTDVWFSTLYATGARNFLWQSMVPLQLVPMYANQTFMFELVKSGNELAQLYLANLAKAYPDTHIGYFDSYSLFYNMYTNPSAYLNGTDPLNVNSSISALGVPPGPRRDSYLWYDSLHPSEQADRIVAREIVLALKVQGNYSTWYS